MTKKRLVPLLLWCAVLAVMIAIFAFSAESAADSTESSDSVLRVVLSFVRRDFSSLSGAEQTALLNTYTHFIRKTAHFLIYALLGFLLDAALVSSHVRAGLSLALSPAVGLLYAATDEIHQLFVPGRSGSVTDVLLDTAGCFVGALIFSLILYLIHRHKNSRQQP